jgi:lipoic acid synthetase
MDKLTKLSRYSNIKPKERLPIWLQRPIGNASQLETVQAVVKQQRLHTICEEGRCPNRGECYAAGTATFLLGGSICTRSCAFCQVEKGSAPQPTDQKEAGRIAEAVEILKLKYVVLTAVARDDLDDHGAGLFTNTIAAIRQRMPEISIEVLTPDFWGGHKDLNQSIKKQRQRLQHVLNAKPVCFNHNLETVYRLQGEVRRGATWERSLGLLAASAELAPNIPTKSGLMLGLGETNDEVISALEALRKVNCARVTIGQYLRPSLDHIPVDRYCSLEEFKEFENIAKDLGFSQVSSGPLVRSSYHAAKKKNEIVTSGPY